MDLKREFDPHLIFNRGSDDLEKMSISELCIRLQRFFKDQDYHTKEMVSDLEATELQLEIVKSKRIYEKMADGSTVTRLEPLENSKPIGISLLRSDEIDEETFYGIQGKYAKYSAIMVFIVGKAIQASKYKFVQGALNESTTKFYVVPFREYYKDMRFVEMNRKQGTEVDVILPKLMRLGLSHGNSGDEKKKIDLKDLSSTRIPMTTRISAILHAVQLHKGIESGETRGVPYIKTILPGSTELYFLVSADKNGRDDVKEVALNLANEKKTVIIVSDLKFIQSDVKLMNSKGIQIWRSTHVNDTRVKVADRTFAKRFVGNLMVELGLSGPDIIGVKIGPNAKITLSSRFNEDVTKMIGCSLVCGITGFSFVNYKPMEIDAYRIDKMSIPESAIITVLAGAAPQGAKASNVTTGEDWTAPVFPPNSKLEVQSGIIVRKKSKISESDSLLAEMKKDL